MAEEKRPNPYPYVTRAQAAAAPGDRIAKGARNVTTRAFQGIPQRAFLMGDNDHSPVMKSVREFVEAVYGLLDSIDLDAVPDGPMHEHHGKVREMLQNAVTMEPSDEG